jgi:hypothetical protein
MKSIAKHFLVALLTIVGSGAAPAVDFDYHRTGNSANRDRQK